MQVSSNEIMTLIGWISLIFLIAPGFLIAYISVYNRRKKKHHEETLQLKQTFQHELLKLQMEVQEQTLKTIATDLHDNINQILGLAVLTLSAVDLQDTKQASQKILATENLTRRAIREIRALSGLLHGEELIGKGLVHAIGFELEWLEKSDRFQIIRKGEMKQLPSQPDKELIIFRIFQESLHNIIRHSQASVIVVELALTNDLLTLRLEDNGIGFNAEAVVMQHSGMGLQNIRKRAAMIEGAASIVSTPGQGTSVTISIPYSIKSE
ncbi:sensor histidine kinase [Chitinophaga sp. RAB17]|uniref:sensor histidine kinase n=1 Tax=Chitinophaga sp. RAB17 TaxID=3233049 RepID=UPI003F90C2DB